MKDAFGAMVAVVVLSVGAYYFFDTTLGEPLGTEDMIVVVVFMAAIVFALRWGWRQYRKRGAPKNG